MSDCVCAPSRFISRTLISGVVTPGSTSWRRISAPPVKEAAHVSASMKTQWGPYYVLGSSRLLRGASRLFTQVATCPLLTLLLLLKAEVGRRAAVGTTARGCWTECGAARPKPRAWDFKPEGWIQEWSLGPGTCPQARTTSTALARLPSGAPPPRRALHPAPHPSPVPQSPSPEGQALSLGLQKQR